MMLSCFRALNQLQVATAAFAGLDALVEWMSCQLVATPEAAHAAARADIIAVLRNFAESLAVSQHGPRGSSPSVQDSPMDFERAEREGGPLMKALLWLARSQQPAHRQALSVAPGPLALQLRTAVLSGSSHARDLRILH